MWDKNDTNNNFEIFINRLCFNQKGRNRVNQPIEK